MIENDHFGRIGTASLPRYRDSQRAAASPGLTLQAGIDRIEVAAEQEAADVDLSDILSRLGTLETLTSGLTRQTVTYCSGGSSSSKTILMS